MKLSNSSLLKNKYSQIVKITLISTLLGTVILVFGCSTATDNAAEKLLPNIPSFRTSAVNATLPRFNLAVKLPDVPVTAPMIETNTPDALETMKRLGETFGLKNEIHSNGKGKYALRYLGGKPDQQTLTMFENSAGYYYRFDNLVHAIPEVQPKLPRNKEAYEIALNYLKDNKLLPEDADISQAAVQYSRPELSEFDAKTGKTLRRFITGVEVRFGQSWEGIPVTGPGSKLYVAIGDSGKVLAVTKMWRNGKKTDAELKTVPPKEALASLQKGEAMLSVPAGCNEATIEKFTFAYWSESPKASQRTAIPLYDVLGHCTSEEGIDLGSFRAYLAGVYTPKSFPDAKPRFIDLEQDIDG